MFKLCIAGAIFNTFLLNIALVMGLFEAIPFFMIGAAGFAVGAVVNWYFSRSDKS